MTFPHVRPPRCRVWSRERSASIAAGKVPAPKFVTSGGSTQHLWTEAEIERVRKLLPKIKNGTKTNDSPRAATRSIGHGIGVWGARKRK